MNHTKQGKIEIIKECLGKVSYFETLTEDELTQLAGASRVVKKRAGEFIVRAGEETTQYFLLQTFYDLIGMKYSGTMSIKT